MGGKQSKQQSSDCEYSSEQIRMQLGKSKSQMKNVLIDKKVYLQINTQIKILCNTNQINRQDFIKLRNSICKYCQQYAKLFDEMYNKYIEKKMFEEFKKDLMQFKKQHNLFKINIFKQLRQMSKILKGKNVIFIFGSSIEQIYFYISKFKQVVGGLKKNSFIENTLIQCFSPIEQQGYVIYPFPTYIGSQQPWELKLYCEFIKLNLNKCLKFTVIILISNTKDDSAFKPLEYVRRCFKQNLKKVLQNLTVYHFNVQRVRVIQKINYQFIPFAQYHQNTLNIRYYSSRKTSRNKLKFLNRENIDEQVIQILDEVYQIIKSQKQTLIAIISNSFKAMNFEVFTQSIQLLENYNQFKPNKVEQLANNDTNIIQKHIESIKKQFLYQNYETNSMGNQLRFLKQISKIKTQSSYLKKIINLSNINDTTTEKLAKITIQNQFKNIKDCKPNKRTQIKKNIQNKAKIFDEIFKENNQNILDKIINQKLDNLPKLKDKQLKEALEELNFFYDRHDYEKKIKPVITKVRQMNYSKDQKELAAQLQKFNDVKNLNFTKVKQMIQNKKKQYQSHLKYDEKCKNLYDAIISKLKQIYKIFAKMLVQIFNDPDPMSQQIIILQYLNILTNLESTGYIQNRENLAQKYKQVKENCAKQRIKKEIQSIRIVGNRDLVSEADRKDFYDKIQKKIKDLIILIKQNKILQEQLRIQCNLINNQANQLYQQCKKIMDMHQISQTNKQSFNFNYSNLKSMKEYLNDSKVLNYIKYPSVEEIDRKLQGKIEDIKNQVNIDNIINLVHNLIELKIKQANFFHMKQIVRKSIDQIIEKYAKAKKDLGILIQQLNASTEGVMIIQDNPNFVQYIQIQNNKKRFQYGIDYVLEKIQFENGYPYKSKFQSRFKNYEQKYNELMSQNDKRDRENNIKNLVGEVRSKFELKNYDHSKFKASLDQLEQLLAYISTIWTLTHQMKFLNYSNNNSVNPNALFKAHPAQIIAMFRIFAFEPGYQNNLVQILSGQGKSVILAFCSVIFALNGFKVNCACYSEYLSQRDFEYFLPLFKTFELHERIFYGTFNKIYSKIMDQNGKISKLVEDLFITGKYIVSESTNMPRVLLIDEVDVFFSEQFYGKYYQPIFTLKDPLFKALTDFIWKTKGNLNRFNLTSKQYNNKWNQIINSNQYKNFVNKYSNYKDLINQGVKQMIYALQTIDGAPKAYFNKAINKIGYQQQDRIDYNASYGYQTLFTYYKMRDEGEFGDSTIEKNAFFKISCGKYSYAQLPHKFTYIVGVTGTLKDLNKQTKKIIQGKYNINKFTYVPSVYGDKKLRFIPQEDIKIFKQNEFQGKLKDMIMSKVKIGRPVLVFFQTEQKLLEFVRNPNNKLDNMSYYTEKATKYEKQKMLAEATRQQKITLLVRSYGRGTDFICKDKNVLANNGVHVIQTFLSEDISEETQIKRRTARQLDPGSYELILLDNHLQQQFKITLAELQSNLGSKLYSFLNEKRNNKFDQKCKLIYQQVEDAKIVHTSSQIFYQSLIMKNFHQAKNGLLTLNKNPQAKIQKYRTAILLDINGFMQNTKSMIYKTIDEIKKFLTQQHYHENCLEIQLVFYRSYNLAWSQQLVYSNWETKVQNLSNFLEKQKVVYDEDQAAIEVALNFIYEQTQTLKINQILLIGSAPPLPSNQVMIRRNKYNKQFWKNSKIGDYKTEAQNLATKGIKVNCFYLHNQARQRFEQIAAITNANATYMDPNSTVFNQDLKITFLAQVLNSISSEIIYDHKIFPNHD